MADRYWIGYIYCPPAVEWKIKEKHNVTLDEVREAILFSSEGRLHNHPYYGERLIVRGSTYEGHRIVAILKGGDETDGTWELKTARRES